MFKFEVVAYSLHFLRDRQHAQDHVLPPSLNVKISNTHSYGSRIQLGVDLAISSSSSFISASMSAKSGVLRYLSPVSASIATRTDPSGDFLAVSTAAHMEAPPEIPVSIPSFLARVLDIDMAAPSGISSISSSSLRSSPFSSTRGMKSGVQPGGGGGGVVD